MACYRLPGFIIQLHTNSSTSITRRCYYRPQRSCGQGYVFTRVCDSVHGGVSRQGEPPQAGRTPPGRENHPPRSDPPEQTPPPGTRHPRSRHPPTLQAGRHPSWEQTPSGTRPPQDQTPPGPDTPPREAHSSIRSTSGRYASYWNAFLFYWYEGQIATVLNAIIWYSAYDIMDTIPIEKFTCHLFSWKTFCTSPRCYW